MPWNASASAAQEGSTEKGNQKPRYENPGHHDEKNKSGEFQYNKNKDPLPKDAHSVYESSIQHGNKRYGRSPTGEYYQYNHSASTNPKSKFDCKEGAYHFAGRTGKDYRGFPIPKAVSDYFGG